MSLENLDLVPIPPQILDLLSQDGFTVFIKGGKEQGKTNLAMLLIEIAHSFEVRKHFATNIKTNSYFIEQITNKPDLDDWLKQKRGLKTYAMDELGKNLRKFGFASKKNQDILEVVQLIRHYDCGFIGMAPAGKFVDSGFLIADDILDAEIKKISKKTAKVKDYLHGETYFWCDIPQTSIIHNGKDIANFNMDRPLDPETSPLCCRVAEYAAKFPEASASMNKIGSIFGLNAEETKRQLIKHLKHTIHSSHIPVEVNNPIQQSEAP